MRNRWLACTLIAALVLGFILVPGYAQTPRTITLTAWTVGPDEPSRPRFTNLLVAADRLNADLAKEGAAYRIKVEGSFDTTTWDAYLRRVLLAFESKKGPDIVQASAVLSVTWSAAGFLAPMDEFIPKHKQFADVVPSLWQSVRYQGKTWGVPQDVEARPLYFNKTLLKRLGWDDGTIATLPDRIRRGEFTWDDMLAVAQEAVTKKVVEPGKGYYLRPRVGPDFNMWYRAFGGRDSDPDTGKLVFTRDAALRYYTWLRRAVDVGVLEKDRIDGSWPRYHQTITDGKVLFFSGGSWNWAEWASLYLTAKGGEKWLFENFDYALQPPARKGGRPITLSNPQAYMIAANSPNKELAVRLLAYTTVPDIYLRHAVASARPSILRSPIPFKDTDPYGAFVQDVSYMLVFTSFQPSHPELPKWQESFFRGVSAVISGELTPDRAVAVVAAELQRLLKDQVIIE